MAAAVECEQLLEHLERTTRLNRAEAERVVAEVLEYFAEPVEDFVARRHLELRAEGCKNPDIFTRIRAEVRTRRFAVPALSERQVRRIVYG
ncbi:MAG: hypothetical protein AB7V27_03185 [Candidatus Binatia bacterium]